MVYLSMITYEPVPPSLEWSMTASVSSRHHQSPGATHVHDQKQIDVKIGLPLLYRAKYRYL